MSRLASLAKSRIVHFLAIGGVLAALAPREREGQTIRATDAESAEREALAREAVRLGIGTSDPIVQARLAERMRANLAKALPPPAIAPEALDAEIARQVAAASERVRLAVWFVPKDQPDAQREVDAIARAVRAGAAPKSPPPPIPDRELWTEEALARVIGVDPAHAAIALPVGASTEPLASAWGFYVFAALERRRAEPAEVRAEALAKLGRERQAAELSRLVERVRRDYAIEITPAASVD